MRKFALSINPMNKKIGFIHLAIVFAFLLNHQIYAQTGIKTYLAQKLAGIHLKDGGKTIKKGISLDEICDLSDPVANRVFREYGAMFVGKDDIFAGFRLIRTDDKIKFFVNCVFQDEREVNSYQTSIRTKSANIGGTNIELREDAMEALLDAIEDGKDKGVRISPRGGSIGARRSFADTARLWDSRFYPALAFWVGKGKISPKSAEAAKRMTIPEQVEQVLEWEDKKLWFSKDLSKSILYSVAAPGASQHIFMVALDVEQYANPQVRKILADHGWFQTVLSDLPHFTYLGLDEDDLAEHGLEPKFSGGQKFWVPKM